ncbi:LysM peptidoglycan-binding domain-containing protein [Pseudomonas sp. CGJS7]|uniref:LysM peptidoglycan-binding domain-containing protein n=1 Tax=Pseudomonas sp. CGJS7 TaxID=3109348 RepID=UPI0030093F6B
MNIPSIDGGPYIPPLAPQNQATTHVVSVDTSVNSIAERYGITPQALRAANPEIFQDKARRDEAATTGGDMIYNGDVLNIPPASLSVTEEPITSDFNPTYPSSTSEFILGGPNAAVTWNPADGTVKYSAGVEGTPASYDHRPTPFGIPNDKASGATFEINVRADTAHTSGAAHKNGNTEVTVSEAESSVMVSVAAGIDGGKGKTLASAELGEGAGFRSRYKVTFPGQQDLAKSEAEAKKINPFDPTTIPKGASVSLDGQTFTQTKMEGTFRYIGTETNVKDASGTSFSVSRTSDTTVRVAMGPNEAVEAFNGVNVGIDGAKLTLGRQDNLGESKVRTADFDISTPDGQAAYAHFVATGEVAHQTPGVSHVATIERVDYSSQTRAKIELGPLGADFAGAQNTGVWTKATHPDGSYSMQMDLQYSGGVPLSVTQRYDAQGNEVLSQRTYQIKVKPDENGAKQLNWALSGGRAQEGEIKAGKTTTLTFSEDQMRALSDQTRSAADTFGGTNSISVLAYHYDGTPVTNTLQFAVGLVRGQAGETQNFPKTLLEISDAADGDIARRNYEQIQARANSG